MKLPCEVVVKNVLPALKAVIVKELTETHKFTQDQIASKLGITQASVSYYLSEKRGKIRVRDSKRLREIGRKIADKIAMEAISPFDIIQITCDFCKSLRYRDIICEMHEEIFPSLRGKVCDVCQT